MKLSVPVILLTLIIVSGLVSQIIANKDGSVFAHQSGSTDGIVVRPIMAATNVEILVMIPNVQVLRRRIMTKTIPMTIMTKVRVTMTKAELPVIQIRLKILHLKTIRLRKIRIL